MGIPIGSAARGAGASACASAASRACSSCCCASTCCTASSVSARCLAFRRAAPRRRRSPARSRSRSRAAAGGGAPRQRERVGGRAVEGVALVLHHLAAEVGEHALRGVDLRLRAQRLLHRLLEVALQLPPALQPLERLLRLRHQLLLRLEVAAHRHLAAAQTLPVLRPRRRRPRAAARRCRRRAPRSRAIPHPRPPLVPGAPAAADGRRRRAAPDTEPSAAGGFFCCCFSLSAFSSMPRLRASPRVRWSSAVCAPSVCCSSCASACSARCSRRPRGSAEQVARRRRHGGGRRAGPPGRMRRRPRVERRRRRRARLGWGADREEKH